MNTNEFILGGKMYSPVDDLDFVEWLQEQMDERGWTQARLAREAGVSRGAIGNVLRRERPAGSELAKAIAKALNLPEEEVFRRANILSPKPEEEPPGFLEWMHRYVSATPEQRKAMLEYVRFITRNNPGESDARESGR